MKPITTTDRCSITGRKLGVPAVDPDCGDLGDAGVTQE
jgi:hypothetical protein